MNQKRLKQSLRLVKKADGGSTHGAMQALDVVVEKYPELKAQSNYQQINQEFSLTENRLANYREAYNSSVQSYKRYIRSFFPRIILGAMGYQNQNYNYLDYKVNNQDARNLFKE